MNTICLVLLALLQVQVESSEFKIYLGGVQVGTEEFSVNRQGDGFVARGRTQLELSGEVVDVRSSMELNSQLRPVAYEFRSGEQILTVRVDNPLAEVEFSVPGEGRGTPYDMRFPPNGMIVDDNFFHHYLLLLYRVGPDGGAVPVFVPQQATMGSVSVEPSGQGTFDLTTENLQLRATTDANGRLIRLESADSSVVIER